MQGIDLPTPLRAAGASWQKTKTWKQSNDPDFVAKMLRILDLYDNPPPDGRVICADEFGPLNLQPRPGRGWWPKQAARKLRPPITVTRASSTCSPPWT
ncbi:hypothetical protein [Pilimelia columellifera]|uniref:Transposase n=1 Tax=Pilimelia columellifera subsp. columellifera TaxID=706583 RepID=A0ABP6B1B3_9ACTN